ncbi:hypothetical protein LINPERHAP1_LOCUS27177 [Linum perenne]
MSTFRVNTNSFFLCGTANGAVSVVDTGCDLNNPVYASDTWKIVATAFGTRTAMTITAAAGSKVYRALEIFDTKIEGEKLDKLCQDLLNSQVLVNRDGYQVTYLGAAGGGINGAGFVIGNNNYLVKLNNLFGWGGYGVKSPEGRIAATVWNRYDVSIGEAVVDYVAAKAKAREMESEMEKRASELRESERRAAEKEEMLGYYKRILEENKELVKEMENGKNRLKDVIEEQRIKLKEKEVEIEGLMKLKEKVVNDDDDGGDEDLKTEQQKMSTFVVNTNSLFLCGNTNGSVSVVDAGSDLNISKYGSDNWKLVATAIGTPTTMTILAAGTKVYRGLKIFGTVIEGQALDKLGKDLLNSQVLANRDGYQVRYLGAAGGEINGAGFVIGNNYYLTKMNNLFGWGGYGVKSPEGRIAATVWNRYDVSIGEAVVDYVAAEAKAREMESEMEKRASEVRESERRAAEKEEMLGYYKRILEENKELVKEMENGKNRLKDVIEEQRIKLKEKEVEIEGLMKLKEKVVNDDDGGGEGLKAAMESALSENGKNRLKDVIEEQRRVIKEKEVQIEELMKLKEKVVNDDDGGDEGLKVAMEAALSDLNRAVRAWVYGLSQERTGLSVALQLDSKCDDPNTL